MGEQNDLRRSIDELIYLSREVDDQNDLKRSIDELIYISREVDDQNDLRRSIDELIYWSQQIISGALTKEFFQLNIYFSKSFHNKKIMDCLLKFHNFIL